MRIRLYEGIDAARIPNFARFRRAVERDDFAAADMGKIGDNLYRARLGKSARLLFSFYRLDEQVECLVLEHLPNHEYEKSRFLARGVTVDESRIQPLENPDDIEPDSLVYLNPATDHFHVLDKVLSFDDEQQLIFELPPPLVIVGSAGSGKTALTLEKMKQTIGDVLYVSLSPYLVESARALYRSNGYDNDDQQVDFLSFAEFLESVRVPSGREANYADFEAWFKRHRPSKSSGLSDPHALFEEFRGVITGGAGERAWLDVAEYGALGVRQSIFPVSERAAVHALFLRYVRHLAEANLYDSNLLAHDYRALVESSRDFVVVDEVQDFTNVQLRLLLQTLRQPGDFLLCGDANQIVHPNFFSWSKLRSLFFEERGLVGEGETLRILHANYRNSPLVTAVANRILKLKQARFGSVDRESNHLVESRGVQSGTLQLLADGDDVRRELDSKTRRSTRFAVLVLHAADKMKASSIFDTPLVFSIQEAKGLEYENIVLFDFIGGEERAFRDIAAGVDAADLESDVLDYARAKDKRDKSLEIYKFYINALYVAITRAVKGLYLVESRTDHPLLRLLDLERFTGALSIDSAESSVEDWQREARRLELQGKQEQAKAIHERILERKPVPWPVMDRAAFQALRDRVLDAGEPTDRGSGTRSGKASGSGEGRSTGKGIGKGAGRSTGRSTDRSSGKKMSKSTGNKKEQLKLYEYALLHCHLPTLAALARDGFRPAAQPEEKGIRQLFRNHFMVYELSSPNAVLKETERYGVDHRTVLGWTPLMVAAKVGNVALVNALLERGADRSLVAEHGLDAGQILLEAATTDPKLARRAGGLWTVLGPDSLSIQVDGRLIKLGGHLMGLFLLNLMFARFYRDLGPFASNGWAIDAGSLEEWVAELPDAILPARRKRRPYISSVLSGNEVDRDAPYNRKLFKRVSRGNYIINPALKIRVANEWVGVHDLLRLEDLGIDPSLPPDYPVQSDAERRWRVEHLELTRLARERRLEAFRVEVRDFAASGQVAAGHETPG